MGMMFGINPQGDQWMAILTRVSRLLSADLHAVIDRLEEPQAQLQQAIREMQQLTQQLEQEQLRSAALQASLVEQQNSLTEQQTTTQQELELCLDAQENALARAVIRRALQLDQRQEQIDKELRLTQTQHQHRAELLVEHQTQLEALNSQAQMWDVSLNDVHSSAGASNLATPGITEAQIDIALLAHQQRRARS